MTIAVCPGSFDPVTAGHLDVIRRCSRFFTQVHVVVAVNAAKTPMFSEHTRVDIIRQALGGTCDNVTVASTDGLITDYCKKVGATVIVKGLRQNGDYEAELGMALVNRKLAGVETLFLPADPVLEHVDNHFPSIPAASMQRFDELRKKLSDMIRRSVDELTKMHYEDPMAELDVIYSLHDARVKRVEELRRDLDALREKLNGLRREMLLEIQQADVNITAATLNIHVIQETELLAKELRSLLKSCSHFCE